MAGVVRALSGLALLAGSALSRDGTAVSFAGLDAQPRRDECVREARTVEAFVPDALASG